MPAETFERTYTFDSDKTCKTEWIFTLSTQPEGVVIEELQIKAHLNDGGKPMGCLGHPETITALLRGLPVSAIDVAALTQAGCVRNVACGQILAQCLTDLQATAKAS